MDILDGVKPAATTGARVRQRRRMLDMTQTGLAIASGLHPMTIHAIEAGKQHPSPESTVALARALGVSVAALEDAETA
jgi:DNA-binding XRE family transcriptional regulator